METSRCKLQRLQKHDISEVGLLYTNEEVRQFLGGAITAEDYAQRFAAMCSPSQREYYWVIRHKVSEVFIGLISLDTHHNGVDMEVSYQLLPSWWGQGYGAETVRAVISYAFEKLGLERLVAETQIANEASCRLLEKLGMRREQIVERFGAIQGIYSISRSCK